MKFRYVDSVRTMKEIELEVPYYYESIKDDYQIYGKLTEHEVVELMSSSYDDSTAWDIEKKYDISDYLGYIVKQENSTEEKFNAAKERITEFLA